jgi:hypothetical protein
MDFTAGRQYHHPVGAMAKSMIYFEAGTSTIRGRDGRNERCPYHSWSGCATAAGVVTFGYVQQSVRKTKADSGQDKPVPGRLEEISNGAIPTAEAATRGNGRTLLQDEESTRHPTLVVWQQTTECESSHTQMSRMEKRT